jgi:hypothetical protein
MAVANALYIWRDKFVRSVQITAFFVFMVFTSTPRDASRRPSAVSPGADRAVMLRLGALPTG